MNEALSLVPLTEGDRCAAAAFKFWEEYKGKDIGGGPPSSMHPNSKGTKVSILSAESAVIEEKWSIVVGYGPSRPYWDDETLVEISGEYEGFPVFFKSHF